LGLSEGFSLRHNLADAAAVRRSAGSHFSNKKACELAAKYYRRRCFGAKGLGSSAAKLLETVSTICSMDVIVPVKRGSETIELR